MDLIGTFPDLRNLGIAHESLHTLVFAIAVAT
jgi:hypothetical protein